MFDYLTHERLTTPLFEQPKKKEKYYDFGSGNKTPKKESSTAERDARVRKAYSERQKKEERDEFLIGFNEFDNEKTFSQKNASKNNNSPSKKNINLDKIFKWDSFDDFQKGFNSSFLNDDEKEFYTQTKSQPQNTTKKYDDSFYRQNYQERAASRKKETDEDVLNIREAKRSINYSLLPQERVRRIADAKESGDAEKYLSLSTGSDLDNFMDFESKVAYKNAKQEYLKRASENGYNPEDFFVQQESDMAGAVAAEEVTKRWNREKQKIFDATAYGKTLNGISNALTTASLVPALDTATNALQIPVDLLRRDFAGAVLDFAGIVPILGEAADAAKTARTADGVADGIKTAETVAKNARAAGKIDDTANAVDAVRKTSARLDGLDNLDEIEIQKAVEYSRRAQTEGYSLFKTFDESANALAEMSNHANYLSKTSPIKVPNNVDIKFELKNGYYQVQYNWKNADDGYEYLSRWHTKTPDAPDYQRDSWVVERKIKGVNYGKNPIKKEHKILLSDGRWIDWDIWKAAKTSKNRTPEQKELLRLGHISPRIGGIFNE